MKPQGILVDIRSIGYHGIGRFAKEVCLRLPDSNVYFLKGPLQRLSPLDPLWLSFVLSKKRPSVFFSPDFSPPLWSPVPFVFTIHDLIHVKFPEETSISKKLYYNAIVKPAIHKAYYVLTVSSFSKNEIIDWSNVPETKVIVVGNGVGSEFTPRGEHYQPGFPYILYVGNLKPHKNFKKLLMAFAISNLFHDVKLVATGYPDKNTISLIKKLNINNSVYFAGVISDEMLSSYYRGAVALAFPSLYEGFGLPALEAMACGTPVVTSNVTALPEVVGDAAVLVDPYDVDSIAEGIRRVVEDSALRETLRRKGLERARQFSWDRTAELTWKVLQEAAENG